MLKPQKKPQRNKGQKPPREGFRRRVTPWYAGMNRKEIAFDTAKTVIRWLAVSALSYLYWASMLLLLSLFLLNVWHVTLVEILIYSAVLCGVTSVVYAGVLVHRKLYY